MATTSAERSRRKFLRHFRKGFHGEKYLGWERDYKWEAHQKWEAALGRGKFRELLEAGKHAEIAAQAVRIESATNLLFSFEKMALRDAIKSAAGARLFATALSDWLHGEEGGAADRFRSWTDAIARLPRRQTRVLTWPLVTVFGFIAQPRTHLFLKPMVTRRAAEAYGFEFPYASKPNWNTYASLLEFGRRLKNDLADLKPRDQIDIQSFIWVLGSDEYS